jgi:hypothetical protein
MQITVNCHGVDQLAGETAAPTLLQVGDLGAEGQLPTNLAAGLCLLMRLLGWAQSLASPC